MRRAGAISFEEGKSAYLALCRRAARSADVGYDPERDEDFGRLRRLDPRHRARLAKWVMSLDGHRDSNTGHGVRADACVRRYLLSRVDASREQDLIGLLRYLMSGDRWIPESDLASTVRALVRLAQRNDVSPRMTEAIKHFATSLVDGRNRHAEPAEIATRQGLRDGLFDALASKGPAPSAKTPDELWVEFLTLGARQSSAAPTSAFRRAAEQALERIGREEAVSRAYGLIDHFIQEGSADPRRLHGWDKRVHHSAEAVRGVVWTLSRVLKDAEWCRVLGRLTVSSLRVVRWGQLRSPKLANACIRSLAEIGTADAITQLAWLSSRVKQKPVRKEIDKAMHRCADAAGMTVADLEELSVPTFGFDADGVRQHAFGDYAATMRIEGAGVSTTWSRANGATLKSVPGSVKASHGPALKDLAAAAREVRGVLSAQRQRIDRSFLLERSWTWLDFRRRYLEHPLLSMLAGRLIWRVDRTAALIERGEPKGVSGTPVAAADDAVVSLWHPLHASPGEVLAWRDRLRALYITQPFKQAHREVYLLTEAERRTRQYSNRFAAHVIRQSQFRTLAGQRGWGTRLIGPWDGGDSTTATRDLPGGLRAEFWLGAAHGDALEEIGETGWTFLATDQVRFYGPNDVEPIPLDQVPPLVFSEVMRDVDLFVGAASVGNDPAWQDGGPGGRYATYWQSYSFGELTETARTRHAVLEALLPRLTKLRGRCSLEERFLVIRGDLRSYKIHLGSGNILMAPNDTYLCVVPDRSPGGPAKDVFLPFEGDATLSIILSKAFLLAEDTNIKDPTITQQIKP